MRYAVFTVYGEGLPVALRLQDEGNEVHFAVLDDLADISLPSEPKEKEESDDKKKRLSLGDGLIEHKHDFKELVKSVEGWKEGFVFCDFNTLWKTGERLKKTGLPGIYPIREDREMETDREKAKEFVKKNYPDLEIGDAEEFDSVEDGLKKLGEGKTSYVLKGNAEGASAVVPDSQDDEVANGQLADVLENKGKDYEKEGFILEERIKDLVELTPEMWFNDGKPLCASVNIETKRLNDGEIGPMTGCSSGLVFPVELDSEICKMAFPKAVMELAKKRGGLFVWDASLYFDPKGDKPKFGEYCPNRCGYDCLFGELALLPKAGDFFEALVNGKNPFVKTVDDFSATMRLFMLDPKNGETPEGVAVNPPEGGEGDFWPIQVNADKEGQMRTTGYYWETASVTGTGNSPKNAMKKAHMNAQNTDLRGKVHRKFDDISGKEWYSPIRRYDWGKSKELW